MNRIAVLGSGMVGSAIAIDLSAGHDVTCFDLDKLRLEKLHSTHPNIHVVAADLADFSFYNEWLLPFDLVVSAVPGFMGYKTLEAIIRAGKNAVDISFFPEDALQLNDLAKKQEVTIITDCGVAPGMSNLILGRLNEEMLVEKFLCYVGGLPFDRKPPFQYKAPFSPIDVIQEYIRPARIVENSTIVTKPALSDREIINMEPAGELEAFNTDGLRSLIFTMGHIPEMSEKTLRYPGHIDIIIALQQAGFFDTTVRRINNADVSPLDFTSTLLIDQWKLAPGEEEFTIMKVIVEGKRNGKHTRVIYDLFDRYDSTSQTSSMARTTGYTCTAAVQLILNNTFAEKGIFPPELVGKSKTCFDFILDYLAARNVNWKTNTES